MKLIRNDLKFKYDNKYVVNLSIKSFDFELEKKQYVCLLKLLEFFDSYRVFNIGCYKYRRLQYDKPERDFFNKNEESKKIYLSSLLKYYSRQVIVMIKEKKEK